MDNACRVEWSLEGNEFVRLVDEFRRHGILAAELTACIQASRGAGIW
ncbi:hypothetical protein [Mycolicibacterium fluoranthenivorans]|uniref:Uncharacterized protein n=1 Tax=Mycolicibacterium fluoranthenivorans TaxID=258505 RepID=A0A1G4WY20_9MYCO|nr:hypothetical protein [Mycolicibacterium fluoranthenivorans]SCX31473.1 hypothetical protein SAMN02799620_05354 [Mycolicibacterium fluoranthenivorans]